MLYFDTSFLVPLFIREPTTSEIRRFVDQLPDGAASTSEWTRIEFSSLLARDVRMDVLTGETALRVDARFESVIGRAFDVIVPARDDFLLARQYLQRHEAGLRAGDALHLAIAFNKRATAIFSLDKGMLKAGSLLGLPVRDATGHSPR
jgi:predicted nucleic acid-binding protein